MLLKVWRSPPASAASRRVSLAPTDEGPWATALLDVTEAATGFILVVGWNDSYVLVRACSFQHRDKRSNTCKALFSEKHLVLSCATFFWLFLFARGP